MSGAPLPAMRLSRAERDRQFSPSLSAKAPGDVLARHRAATSTLWEAPGLDCLRDLAHGPAPRAKLDLVRPAGAGPFPCVVVLHGGFWQEGDKGGSGFAAQAMAHAGWASALIGYTLAPEARLAAIVDEVAGAVAWLNAHADELRLDPARLVLAGHSAGAQLAAALVCARSVPDVSAHVAGGILISGVYDLAPVAASYVNDAVGMSPDDAAALSLMDARPQGSPRLHIVVGADEPEAFREQSSALWRAWSAGPGRTSYEQVPGRDHFDILDELADPDSASFAAILEAGR